MTRRAVIMVAALFAICPTAAIGEPSPAVQWLMNEPVTLFDWGLYRLEEALQRSLTSSENMAIHVEYDRGDKRIKIWGIRVGRAKDLREARERCRLAIAAIRRKLFVDPKTGKGLTSRAHSSVSTYFRHQAFRWKSQPKEFALRLDDITDVLAVTVADDKKMPMVRCHGPLVSAIALFEKSPD